LCENLPWDSKFFGRRIARVTTHRIGREELDDILSWCDAQATECLYFLADMADTATVRLAEDNGFRLVDIRVVLKLDLAESTSQPLQNDIGQVRTEEIPYLIAIAGTSYEDSRFYHDVNFPKERCAALYETWIEKSCRGYADAVLVAKSGSLPIGYVSCHLTGPDEGQIGLVGVHRDAARQGVGQELVNASVGWFRQADVKQVTVVTQGRNWRGQRLYQRCGFVTQSMHLWYHRWFVRPESVS
jgi:dTDP-4-amino-4,6-dideoxy-D-galactose acyltransferase